MVESASPRTHYIGLDLGGTKILGGAFDEHLTLLGTAKVSTEAHLGPEAVMDRIAQCVRETIAQCGLPPEQVRGLGLGAPGAVDPSTGNVLFAPNLDWRNFPLKRELEQRLQWPVLVENDCNVCVLGVHEVELNAKPRHLIGLFIGTGIGGGLILDGNLYSGFNHTAGEVGHMIIEHNGPECRCGNRGCFEALASRTAMFNQVKTAVQNGQSTLLTGMLGNSLNNLRSGDLRKAIAKGDLFVAQVVDRAAEYIGIAVANLVNLLNPEAVVLGGGIIDALHKPMMPVIRKVAIDRIMPGTGKGIRILASELSDHAGITGGAVLVRRGFARLNAVPSANRRHPESA